VILNRNALKQKTSNLLQIKKFRIIIKEPLSPN